MAHFALAAVLEIAGCYAVFAWWCGASALWLILGALALAGFAWLLAIAPSPFAGRSYAAYGGVYIAASLSWLMIDEGARLTMFDLGGAALALAGAGLILLSR